MRGGTCGRERRHTQRRRGRGREHGRGGRGDRRGRRLHDRRHPAHPTLGKPALLDARFHENSPVSSELGRELLPGEMRIREAVQKHHGTRGPGGPYSTQWSLTPSMHRTNERGAAARITRAVVVGASMTVSNA